MNLPDGPLSGFTEVLDEGDASWIRLVEPGLEMGQEACGGLLQRGSIGPPAMAAELSFAVAPDALHQVQLRSVGW
jgi:hypothetical protein